MKANEYQSLAARTLLDHPGVVLTPEQSMFVWNAIGLAGEAGEVADYAKKVVFHGHTLEKQKIKKELGDVIWYICAVCRDMGFTLEDVMIANIEKLRERYPEGFTTDASKNRDDHA